MYETFVCEGFICESTLTQLQIKKQTVWRSAVESKTFNDFKICSPFLEKHKKCDLIGNN